MVNYTLPSGRTRGKAMANAEKSSAVVVSVSVVRRFMMILAVFDDGIFFHG